MLRITPYDHRFSEIDEWPADVDLILSALEAADPRTGQRYEAAVSLRVPPSAGLTETLQRALTRPPAQRFDPVLCTARNGEVLGLLRVDDLASAAATR